MKISKEYLKQIIKEEMGRETDPKQVIADRVRGTPEVEYLNNREQVEKALNFYFSFTSEPAVVNAVNFVLGWVKGSKK